MPHRLGASAPERLARRRCGYSLLEMLLVLVLIGMLASLLLPSLSAPLAKYHLQQAAGEFRAQLGNARLRAMETGQLHAVLYTPRSDRYRVCSIDEPPDVTAAIPLQRRTFSLNGSSPNRRLRFLAPTKLVSDREASLTGTHSLTNHVAVFRSFVGPADVLIVFAGDGTAHQNMRVGIRDQRSQQAVEITITALTGSVLVSTPP